MSNLAVEQPKIYTGYAGHQSGSLAGRQRGKFVKAFLIRMTYFINCVGFSCNCLSDSILTNCMFPSEQHKKYTSLAGCETGRQAER